MFCFFFWASSFIHCLAALDFGAGVEQPFRCLIVQNRQAVQSMVRSMNWTLEDNMADGLFSCATLTGRRGGIPHLHKQERKRPTPVRLRRTQALLGRVIPGGWVLVTGIKMRSLVGLSPRSAFHWWSAHCAAGMLLLSEKLMSCCALGTNGAASWGAVHLHSMVGWALSGTGVQAPVLLIGRISSPLWIQATWNEQVCTKCTSYFRVLQNSQSRLAKFHVAMHAVIHFWLRTKTFYDIGVAQTRCRACKIQNEDLVFLQIWPRQKEAIRVKVSNRLFIFRYAICLWGAVPGANILRYASWPARFELGPCCPEGRWRACHGRNELRKYSDQL